MHTHAFAIGWAFALGAGVLASCGSDAGDGGAGAAGNSTAGSGGAAPGGAAGSSHAGGSAGAGAAGAGAESGAAGTSSDASAGVGGVAGAGGSAGAGAAGTAGAGAGGTAGAAGNAGAAGSGGSGGALIPTTPGLKVAFFGDSALNADSRAVLALIVQEQADLAIHLGDFDYQNDPAAWQAQMNTGLPTTPWLAVVGNHDLQEWASYKQVIEAELATIPEASCVGVTGEQHSCTFRGLHIVLSGIGLLGTAPSHESFIRQALGASSSLWRMCGWHVNQHDTQLGTKPNESGWGVHQECAAEGAMIVNGHEHTYGRTYALTDVGNRTAGHGAAGAWDLITLGAGRTFVTYNGMGGNSLRAYDASHDTDTWWARGYTSDREIQDSVRTAAANGADRGGAAFIEFGVDGDPAKARGTFKTIGGRDFDAWTITVDGSSLGGGGAAGAAGAGGTGTAGAGGTPSGWDSATCATFCAKCDGCYTTEPTFDDGDCRNQGAPFTLQSCLDGCAAGVTPAFDPTGLPSGWQAWTCTELDANI